MSNNNQDKKLVKVITAMDHDFAKWYTDIVKQAELIDYSSVKGCMILRPYGYAIWENIQKLLDEIFKQTNHENVYMPLFIPEGLLQKEKDHVEGFAPEVAWVTFGGEQKLTERLCVRPTSETLFCEHFKHIINSYRDLPKLYNQWCNVVRWEKSTRPFLRSTEFLWQEGHTMHESKQEAIEETEKMLNIFALFYEKYLAIPVIKGKKTEKEKFAGAKATYTVEAMMHDGKALQGGTSHYFGDGFAKAFDIKFTDRNNNLQYPHQTSWGVSTRMIGAIIMSHGDDNGLVLPYTIAPIQIVIIPIAQHKPGVIDKAIYLQKILKDKYRVKLDDSDNSPGWKFAQYELKGVPLRIEIGPKDIENNQCVIVRRDNRQKYFIDLDSLEDKIAEILNEFQAGIWQKAFDNMKNKTFIARNLNELDQILKQNTGFIKAMWCGDQECELSLKDKFGITSRCQPFNQETIDDNCICCGKKAKTMVIWGKAY